MTSLKKELSYGSFDEFLKKAEFDFSTFNFNNLNICNALLKLYDKGNSLLQTGEDENAYFLLMRFFEGYLKLKKSKLYKEDSKYVDDLIPGDKLRKAVEKLEKLKADIKKRYEEKEKSKIAASVSKINVENVIKNEIEETRKAAIIPIQNYSEKGFLSPSEFIELVTKTNFTLLLIDLRDSNDFNLCFMNLNLLLNETRKSTISYINIPSSLVEAVTWKLEESLKSQTNLVNVLNKAQTAAHVFLKRSQFDYLILFDYESEYLKLKSDSKLFILKRAIFEYADSSEKCKNEPIILDGGWKTWIFYYPGYTFTNKKPIEANKEPIKTKPEDKKPSAQNSNSNANLTNNISKSSTSANDKNNVPKPSEPNQTAEKPSVQPSNRTNQEKQIGNEPVEREQSGNKSIDKDGILLNNLPDENKTDKQEQRQANEQALSNNSNRNSNFSINSKQQTNLIPTIDRSNKPSFINKNESDNVKYIPNQTNTKEVEEKNADQENLSNKENTRSENANNSIKFKVINRQVQEPKVQPPSLLPNALSNATNLNETIFNTVYAPTRTSRSFQTPYMKEGSKVLDPSTGMFSYVPQTQLNFVQPPSSSSLQQAPKPIISAKEPQIRPQPTQLPSQTKKLEPKPKTNLKRTLSSPNIAKLDDDDELSDDPPEVKHMPDLSKLAIKPTAVSANSKPMVNRNNKPMSEQVVRSRMEELQPVFGNNPPGLTGIKNLGNTCFINSIIQCLNSCQQLVEYFVMDKFKEDLNRTNDLGFRGEIADEFSIIVKAIWSGHCRIISPRRFKVILGQFNQQFISNEQQDAQELLLFLLDGLHEDLNRVTRRPKITHKDDENENLSDREGAELAWNVHLSINNSIIVDLFQGQFKSTVTCSVCNKNSVKFDAFMYLTLPLFSTKCDIYQCLQLFLHPESMSGESKWKCPRCKQYRNATKKIDIWRLPPMLIIHLKRFKYQGMWRDKITTKVDFPLDNLSLNSFIGNEELRNSDNFNYRLVAVSNHTGTMDGGHYTAVCRHSRRWFKFDDTNVKECDDLSSIVSSASYILFYSRF